MSSTVELKVMPPVFLTLKEILGGFLFSRIPTDSNSCVNNRFCSSALEASNIINTMSVLCNVIMMIVVSENAYGKIKDKLLVGQNKIKSNKIK